MVSFLQAYSDINVGVLGLVRHFTMFNANNNHPFQRQYIDSNVHNDHLPPLNSFDSTRRPLELKTPKIIRALDIQHKNRTEHNIRNIEHAHTVAHVLTVATPVVTRTK